ncbi:glycosyl hydrolase family 32 [Wenyingzhuangia fucanilytica]|uniref:Glycosyl hydrolase family 32 n=1 Tax=Wenyingzhuangia fucanilytica TaxID=1790137 RepID=A0A1B1Y4E1_9FLAO|nr:glycoside hydrolase family 32 protein [Wenyingzhuangia fucanilytica]ANW95646.1 glycosyl hydrolase family 32 [Wenyingzhuangia fucanilytica]
MKKFTLTGLLLIAIIGCNSIHKNEKKSSLTLEKKVVLTEEQLYRPNFHFTPEENWMNDPNGMFYLDGTYHLYFQYYPNESKWGPMHWGHATSTDLIAWKQQPIALYPDKLGYIFSGSAVVDHHNTSGFGDGTQTPVVAIYTYHNPIKEKAGKIDIESQGIAYSLDNGMTWTKYSNNPVLKNPGIKNFRDPKVTWDDIHQQWIMTLAANDRAQFYSSKNLIDWTYLSEFGQNIGAHGGVWECPDFFPMKINDSANTKWVLLQSLNPGGPNGGSATQYFIGDFDGKTFKLDPLFKNQLSKKEALWLDSGKDNYAGVTWNNSPSVNPTYIGWMSNWQYAQEVPTKTWRSSMTLPRELTLLQVESGYKLISTPVSQLGNYFKETIIKKDIVFKKNTSLLKSEDLDLSKSVIDVSLKNMKTDIYTFSLNNTIGDTLEFGINNKENFLFIDRKKSGIINFSNEFANKISKANLDKRQSSAAFKIILDKTSIEVFFNNGEEVLTEIFFTNQPYMNLSIESSGKDAEISILKANQLNIN